MGLRVQGLGLGFFQDRPLFRMNRRRVAAVACEFDRARDHLTDLKPRARVA